MEEPLVKRQSVCEVCSSAHYRRHHIMYGLCSKVQEFHYANQIERQTVRNEVRMAKNVQNYEELRLQAEYLRRVEERLRVVEENEVEAVRLPDIPIKSAQWDSTPCQSNEKRLAQLQLERRDELMARNLQEREERRYEFWKSRQREKELHRERRRLERDIALEMSKLTSKGTNEDFSDFLNVPSNASDTLRAHLISQQDEELARLLQEQEQKRQGGRGPSFNIEEKDQQLAMILQEQEELRANRKRLHRRNRQRFSDTGTQTTQEQLQERTRGESPIYDQLAASWTTDNGGLSVDISESRIDVENENNESDSPLYFDNGSPLIDINFVGSPVTRLDDKIKAGNKLVERKPGTRESLIVAVTGSAELGAQLATRISQGSSVKHREKETPPTEVYAVSQIPRVIPVDPPAGHTAQIRQPGPFAYENSTLFRPAVPFTVPDTATTPLGPTFNIAAAIDPTYNKQQVRKQTRVRPKSMYDLRTQEQGIPVWEEGVPIPIHGERRMPSDPRLNVSPERKGGGNCKVQ